MKNKKKGFEIGSEQWQRLIEARTYLGKKYQAAERRMKKTTISKRIVPAFKLVKRLGQGTFGKVGIYKNLMLEPHQRYVIIKTIKKDPEEHKAILTEFMINESLNKLDHAYTCHFVGNFQDAKNVHLVWTIPRTSHLISNMVSPLLEYVSMNEIKLPPLGKDFDTVRLGLSCSLVRALNAIHAHGVAHRDLKPGNILVYRDFAHQFAEALVPGCNASTDFVRFIDFGLACTDDKHCSSNFTTGTFSYAAPELMRLQHKIGAKLNYTQQKFFKSDLFALARIIFDVLYDYDWRRLQRQVISEYDVMKQNLEPVMRFWQISGFNLMKMLSPDIAERSLSIFEP